VSYNIKDVLKILLGMAGSAERIGLLFGIFKCLEFDQLSIERGTVCINESSDRGLM